MKILQTIQQKLTKPKDRIRIIGVLGAIGIIVVVAFIVNLAMTPNDTPELLLADNREDGLMPLTGQFIPPDVGARSIIVWDVRSEKALYEKNSTDPYPLASITKILAAITAAEYIPKHTAVTITPTSLEQEGDDGLIAFERWLLNDLLEFSLIESSNDGMTAIAGAAGALLLGNPNEESRGRVGFIDLMNYTAEDIGLEHTSFLNESGLDIYDETAASGFGSARDVAKLFSYTLEHHPHLLEATAQEQRIFTTLDNNRHVAENTNQSLHDLPALIGSKTGYTDISGGNLAVVIDPTINRPFVIVVLGSTFENRFSDVVALSEATLQYLKSNI